MTDKTATQSAYEDDQRGRAARSYARFHERWAPKNDHYGDTVAFDFDLAALLAEVREEALRPFIEAAGHHLAMMPPSPVSVKTTGHTQED